MDPARVGILVGLCTVLGFVRWAIALAFAGAAPLAGAEASNLDAPAFEVVPSGDRAYRAAAAGILPVDKGGLASATVVRLTRDTTVYRFWSDAGPARMDRHRQPSTAAP